MKLIHPKASQEKELYGERYALSIERIRLIQDECQQNKSNTPASMHDYFAHCASFCLLTDHVYHQVADGTLYKLSEEELQAQNHQLYEDILPEHYAESYANPAHAHTVLGEEYAPSLCLLYTELRANIVYAFEQRLFYLTTSLELFIQIYNLLEDNAHRPGDIQRALYYYVYDYADITIADRTEEMLNPENSFAAQLLSEVDLNDPRYLYYYGEYISDNERGTAAHLNSMTQTQLTKIASVYTQGYQKGFALYGIDLSQKDTVNIRFPLGFERIVRIAMEQFEEMGLHVCIYRAAVSLTHKNSRGIRVGYLSTSANPQYDYDHRFDESILWNKALADRRLAQQRVAYEQNKQAASHFAGPAVIETFGEKPFTPEAKREAACFHDKQKQLQLEYQSASSLLTNEYIPGDQVSFTIVSYPIPEIGADYEAIFDETIRVNTLDASEYERIQTLIIRALDHGETVTVTGRNGNLTKLCISLPTLTQPESQTNFENCLADVNIPLGEVFTSPKLNGTHGVLHVTQVYLNELKYKDLTLHITDGMITEYDCGNFASPSENKKYIEQNLLFGHETLPMGEFAIGTNTTAYAMGHRFGISHLLPILIAEKTGPHFAFGDTCFSHEEDLKTYNPDGKQMMAKDNAISLLRHTTPEKAYFQCHTDITIPYHELGDIVVHGADGTTIDIIKNGRFVLPGTESLNQPLDVSHTANAAF